MELELRGERSEEAARADVRALRVLLERHGRGVRDTIAGKIGRQWRSLLDADDVMQATYLEAFLHLDQFTNGDESAFVRWLSRIAENNLRDAIRALQRQKRPDPRKRVHPISGEDSFAGLLGLFEATSATPSRHAARKETAEIIAEAIASLPPDYATAVRLYDLEGHSAREAAAGMNRSIGAFYILRARAHDRLRFLLGSASQFFSNSV